MQSACSFACWAFISSSMPRVKSPCDGPPETMPVTMPATASSPPARWCAVTPTVHFSAAVTFLQSASPSFSSVATASRAFPSSCPASASVLAPIDVLPFSSGMQPAPPDSASINTSNEAGRNRHWPGSRATMSGRSLPPRSSPVAETGMPPRSLGPDPIASRNPKPHLPEPPLVIG